MGQGGASFPWGSGVSTLELTRNFEPLDPRPAFRRILAIQRSNETSGLDLSGSSPPEPHEAQILCGFRRYFSASEGPLAADEGKILGDCDHKNSANARWPWPFRRCRRCLSMAERTPAVGTELQVSDFQYHLPPEAIAQVPADRRDGSRLLILDRARPEHGHRIYSELPELVRGDELFVLNDTRVVPARLHARKPTGGRVELLVTGADPHRPGAMLALGRSSKPLRAGTPLRLEGGLELQGYVSMV